MVSVKARMGVRSKLKKYFPNQTRRVNRNNYSKKINFRYFIASYYWKRKKLQIQYQIDYLFTRTLLAVRLLHKNDRFRIKVLICLIFVPIFFCCCFTCDIFSTKIFFQWDRIVRAVEYCWFSSETKITYLLRYRGPYIL